MTIVAQWVTLGLAIGHALAATRSVSFALENHQKSLKIA